MPKRKLKPKLCPIWPNCDCAAQGYVNMREGKEWGRPPCGKKPTRQRDMRIPTGCSC